MTSANKKMLPIGREFRFRATSNFPELIAGPLNKEVKFQSSVDTGSAALYSKLWDDAVWMERPLKGWVQTLATIKWRLLHGDPTMQLLD